MVINTKIRYGLRTMIEIANSTEPNGVLQKDIAERQNISVKYLDAIIAALKVKGLIVNSKGRGSGYKLAKEPKDVTMMDIYTAFEPIVVVDCINNLSFCDRQSHECTANNFWQEFGAEFRELLNRKTLEEVIHKTKYECNKLV
jgi:Rrf2 family transcriptional regulator, iron-sulfur cluster assembly transcription factor